ncbi:chromatin assembly factor 1 subunit A-domain-containing protein [Pilobolus umbonatus]|nr:chromatin assembly factor 1 subunit A-domain-containing protein [Pilobolus umbonatus]
MILLLEKGENRFDVLYDLVRSSNLKNINRTSVIFTPFEASEYVTVAPNLKYPTKKFDTDMINQLTRSDLREVFLDSLASRSKRKRGYVKDEDMCAKELEKAWLQFNRAVGRERDGFYNSSLYKRIKTLKMKLLQFHEDIRPAYYGTWTKRCHIVDGRHPFAKEDNLLNYQHDSEAEWDIDVDINDNISITFSMDDDDPIQLMSSDDEWMLSPTEDEMSLYNGMGDTDSIMSNGHCSEGKRATWLVPNGYLSEGEGIHVKQTPYRRRRRQLSIVSRPASWPISTNKHFPLKPIILGPSFEVADEPVNHPLSDFRLHFINDEICPEGCYPFDEMPYDSSSYKYHLNLESEDPSNIASSKVICYEPSKVKPLMYARESDKILDSIREGVIEFIKGNNTKTMMELMIMIRKSKLVCDYSISQLQAIIHDLAYQTVGEDNKEYVWCIR